MHGVLENSVFHNLQATYRISPEGSKCLLNTVIVTNRMSGKLVPTFLCELARLPNALRPLGDSTLI